jgi:hypothetical protein
MVGAMKAVALAWTSNQPGQQFIKHKPVLEVNMKIGLSFSRCMRDIYQGRVNSHDVMVIIARTLFDPNVDEEWADIWSGYGGGGQMGGAFSNPEWIDIPAQEEEAFRHLVTEMYNGGLIHQPRKFGGHPARRREIWLETVLPSEELELNQAAKKAWDNFQTIAGLTNVKLDKEYK